MSAAPIYVVVCENDKPHPRWGIDPGGAIVHERYVNGATLEAAHDACRRFEQLGACRIGRVVFEGEPGLEVTA